MYSDIIKNFEFKDWPKDIYEFVGLIRNSFNEDYGFFRLWGNKLWISTGGWSENESVMSSVEANKSFSMFLEEWRRGGHYKYELPKKK